MSETIEIVRGPAPVIEVIKPQGPAGPQGPPGPQGPQGPVGPSTGPAGGDLSGTYPNPTVVKSAGNFGVGGQLIWAGDTNLYRGGVDALKTDDNLYVARDFYVWPGAATQIRLRDGAGQPMITFGSAEDTNLYRSGADTLRTDDIFIAKSFAFDASGGILSSPGYMQIISGAANDQIIFKSSTAEVARFNIAGNLVFGPNRQIGWSAADGTAVIDTNLYRWAADYLKTDDSLAVAGNVRVATADSGNGLYFGSAADTNLYRAAADTLKTDDALVVAGSIIKHGNTGVAYASYLTPSDTQPTFYIGAAAGSLNWGGGGTIPTDTGLSRTGVKILTLDSALTLLPIAVASVPNATLFRDNADGKLKYKDPAGAVQLLY